MSQRFVLRLSNHSGSAVEIGPFLGRALADKLANDYPDLVTSVYELARPEMTMVLADILRHQDQPSDVKS